MYGHERALVKKYADQPFVILGVNSDDDVATPQDLAKAGTVTWRSFQDGSLRPKISERWHVSSWPTLYLIDAKGTIRHQFAGNQNGKQLEELIDALVTEATADQ